MDWRVTHEITLREDHDPQAADFRRDVAAIFDIARPDHQICAALDQIAHQHAEFRVDRAARRRHSAP